jgi:hypothetical protein
VSSAAVLVAYSCISHIITMFLLCGKQFRRCCCQRPQSVSRRDSTLSPQEMVCCLPLRWYADSHRDSRLSPAEMVRCLLVVAQPVAAAIIMLIKDNRVLN